MRLLFGLGNPGPKYVDTRHNFGFLLLERVSELLHAQGDWELKQEKTQEGLAHLEGWSGPDGVRANLIWPLTFMNLSGRAVAFFVGAAGPDFDVARQTLTVIDDLSLPLGQMKLRPRGSSGGHNGLKSIEECLGTRDYPRLKLGIDRPHDGSEIIDYVLGSFTSDEQERVQEVLGFGAERCLEWLGGASLPTLTGEVNGWRPPVKPEETQA